MTMLTLEKEFKKVSLNQEIAKQIAKRPYIKGPDKGISYVGPTQPKAHKCSSSRKAFFMPFTAVAAVYALGGDFGDLAFLTTITAATLAGASGLVLYKAINAYRHRGAQVSS